MGPYARVEIHRNQSRSLSRYDCFLYRNDDAHGDDWSDFRCALTRCGARTEARRALREYAQDIKADEPVGPLVEVVR